MGAVGKRERRLTGIIVHLRDLSESDRVVELLTGEAGRVSAVARGARVSRRRFAGVLDLYVSVEARLVPRDGLWGLEGVEARDQRLGLRADFVRLGQAAVLTEAVRVLVPEHQEAQAAVRALAAGLDALAAGDGPRAGWALAELLAAAGVLPERLTRISDAALPPVRELLTYLEEHTGRPLRSLAVLRQTAGPGGGWA